MQDIFASVRRSLVFRPPLDNDDSHSPAIGVGALVDKINSSIRKSRVFSRHSPSSSALPPIPKDTDPPIRWRKGELIGCGAFGRVYMGMNLGSGELLAVKQVWFLLNSVLLLNSAFGDWFWPFLFLLFEFWFGFRFLFTVWCWISFWSFFLYLSLSGSDCCKWRFEGESAGLLLVSTSAADFNHMILLLLSVHRFLILEFWFSSLKLSKMIFLLGQIDLLFSRYRCAYIIDNPAS